MKDKESKFNAAKAAYPLNANIEESKSGVKNKPN